MSTPVSPEVHTPTPANKETLGAQRLTIQPRGVPVLRFERVSKWYGPVIGVNQVTLELHPGITGLVGSNGAGKSTLMRLATGQARPDLGRITVLGLDAWSSGARLKVGYSPEVDAFYEEMSGRQFVLTMARLNGFSSANSRHRTEEVLRLVGMEDRADRRLRGYSKGMRQRIKVAQALLADPPLLVLDEPLSGIDPVGRQEFIELFLKLAEQGKCLLISSHELEELEKLTDHVAIMARGRIAAVGSVTEIRDQLNDHPLSIRIDVSNTTENGSSTGTRPTRHRQLAAALLGMEEVAQVEICPADPLDPEIGRLIVRARHPRTFFEHLSQLVVEEWYELRHVEPLDENTAAVVGYLLGGSAR